jgi:hypothetical protein
VVNISTQITLDLGDLLDAPLVSATGEWRRQPSF